MRYESSSAAEHQARAVRLAHPLGEAVASCAGREYRVRGEAITPTDAGSRVLAVEGDRADVAERTLATGRYQ